MKVCSFVLLIHKLLEVHFQFEYVHSSRTEMCFHQTYCYQKNRDYETRKFLIGNCLLRLWPKFPTTQLTKIHVTNKICSYQDWSSCSVSPRYWKLLHFLCRSLVVSITPEHNGCFLTQLFITFIKRRQLPCQLLTHSLYCCYLDCICLFLNCI